MKSKVCALALFTALAGWVLVCGLSAFAQDLTVNGNVNLQSCTTPPCPTLYSYRIDGSNMLRIFQSASDGSNLYVGKGAGVNLNGAESSPTTLPNAFFGNFAGRNTTIGSGNTALGYAAGSNNVKGGANTYIGYKAAGSYQASPPAGPSGGSNTFVGYVAGYYITGGNANTYLGAYAGFNNPLGNSNIFIGYYAGQYNHSGNSSIYLGNVGANESATIRIGDSSKQNATYVAGIFGQSTTTGSPVFVDATGKLGTVGGGVVTAFNGRTGYVVPMLYDYPPALLGTGTPDLTTFLRGDGTWAVPGGGGGNYIVNGTTQQKNANFNIDGTGTAAHFDIQYYGSYKINGSDVLSVGDGSGVSLGVGAGNSASTINVGYNAGRNTSGGNSNIYIGSLGTINSGDYETNTIRIGAKGYDTGQQSKVYIEPIVANYVGGSAEYVTIDTYTGQLGHTNYTGPRQEVIEAQQKQIADLQQRIARLEAFIEKK